MDDEGKGQLWQLFGMRRPFPFQVVRQTDGTLNSSTNFKLKSFALALGAAFKPKLGFAFQKRSRIFLRIGATFIIKVHFGFICCPAKPKGQKATEEQWSNGKVEQLLSSNSSNSHVCYTIFSIFLAVTFCSFII